MQAYQCGGLPEAEALAQARRQAKRTPDQLVAGLVRDDSDPGGSPSAARVELAEVLVGIADYAPARVEAVLDGLERIALTGLSSDVRAEAALSLSVPGSRQAVKPRPGIAARLMRVYGRSNDRQVRGMVVEGLARSVEHQEAIAFLEKVATGERPGAPGSSLAALTAIAAHGDQASPVLRRLHLSGAIKDPDARHWLEFMAQRGYRVR